MINIRQRPAYQEPRPKDKSPIFLLLPFAFYICPVRIKLIIYGVLLALLIIGLKLAEYKFVIHDHAIEIYAGIVALLFTILGVTAGRKFTAPKEVFIEKEVLVHVPAPSPGIEPIATDIQLEKLGISKREYEILLLMAQGLSNQEIAEKTYVSLSTIKTHVSNILLKLGAKRRTQAVTRARELHLLS